jgi:glycosyltransferase involved in cell wall biosynthesis
MKQKDIDGLLASGDDDALAGALRRAFASAAGPGQRPELRKAFQRIADRRGSQFAFNLLQRLEVAFSVRRPTLAIYDHTLHLIGGAQKYGCTIAHALQDAFDVTIISNKPVRRDDLSGWYQLDLSRCRLQVIPLPFYEAQGLEHLDPAAITSRRMANPFHAVSRESGRYDFFINNSMVEMVYPLAGTSIYICHFPERRPDSYFYVDRYRHLVFNSLYTARWIRAKWQLQPGIHLYPPVDMDGPVDLSAKEDIILSAARFDPGGNKQQRRMLKLFRELLAARPRLLQGWKLVLAGGSPMDNPYLQQIRQDIAGLPPGLVELHVNISAGELRNLYRRARIFWHLCGLDREDPELVEHFGMTTVEAMQNGCVPVVFAGGGLVEIVEADASGMLFSSRAELARQTLQLIREPGRVRALAEAATRRGAVFSRSVFESRVRVIFRELLDAYRMDG